MDINEIGRTGFLFQYETGKAKRNVAGTGYSEVFEVRKFSLYLGNKRFY